MMMVPMGLAITSQIASALKERTLLVEVPKFEKALIFGNGYAGTIGGLGTLIGTPPNIILAAQMQQLFDVEISFFNWMLIGVPLVFFLLFLTSLYLGKFAFHMNIDAIPGGKQLIEKERASLGRITSEEKAVAIVFVITAFM